MGKFNTHGGYFSPQGYLRINAGGSHDENPNGGVQLGKDPQGIPNMLEENEPVYNDFVYSDNITASREMLKKYKLPEKYAGKLFSEIADKFVDEAAIRPNDPVSNNGLNKMLVRLADAQEEQKQLDEQAELEKEVANLSPEEQEALAQMIAQQEYAEQAVPVQTVPQEAVAVDPTMAQQEAMMQPQVMAKGGLLRKFEDGTPGAVVDATQDNVATGYLPGAMYNPSSQPTLFLDPNTGNYYAAGAQPQAQALTLPTSEVVFENPNAVDETYYGGSLQPSVAVAFPGKSQAWVDAEVGPRSIKKQVGQSRDEFLADAYDMYQNNLPLQILTGTPGMIASAVGDAAKGNYGDAALNLAFAGMPFLKRSSASSAGKTKFSWKEWKEAHPHWKRNTAIGLGAATAAEGAIGAGVAWNNSHYDPFEKTPRAGGTSVGTETEPEIAWGVPAYAKGGLIRKFNKGGEKEDNTRENLATGYLPGALFNPSRQQTLVYDPATGNYYTIGTTAQAQAPAQQPAVLNPEVVSYLASGQLKGAMYPTVVAQTPVQQVAGKTAVSSSRATPYYTISLPGALYSGAPSELLPHNVNAPLRPYDELDDDVKAELVAGAKTPVLKAYSATTPVKTVTSNQTKGSSASAGSTATKAGVSAASTTAATTPTAAVTTPTAKRSPLISEEEKAEINAAKTALQEVMPKGASTKLTNDGLAEHHDGDDTQEGGPKPLQTISRYAGLGIDAAGMLYNAFQQPTKFTTTPYTPVLTYATMPLTDYVYNPLDVNQVVNDVLATSAGTARQIANAGQGPSTGALLISNGYNTGKNIGSARLAVVDKNNQRYNDVVSARNGNAKTQAEFQAGLGTQRSNNINTAAFRNQQTDLMLQRLNDASETEKFTTLGQYSDSIKNALAGMGRENLNINTLNATPGRDYDITKSGLVFYNNGANNSALGRLLKNYKKR